MNPSVVLSLVKGLLTDAIFIVWQPTAPSEVPPCEQESVHGIHCLTASVQSMAQAIPMLYSKLFFFFISGLGCHQGISLPYEGGTHRPILKINFTHTCIQTHIGSYIPEDSICIPFCIGRCASPSACSVTNWKTSSPFWSRSQTIWDSFSPSDFQFITKYAEGGMHHSMLKWFFFSYQDFASTKV